MKTIITSLFLCLSLSLGFAQGIFDANIHTATPFGDVNFPAAESPQEIIDQDPMTKFLDFLNLDGMGFEVDLGNGNAEIATSIAIVTANDAPERDPTEYEIFGSNDGVDYTSIASGSIPCISDRFLSRTFAFTNATAYSIYRVNLTGNCSPANINQVADVQLFTTIGNAPSISCPENIVVTASAGNCSGIANFEVTGMDVEDGAITPVQVLGPAAGEEFPVGNTPVVFTVTDSDGNSISCDFIVTVEDEEFPAFDCPSDMTINVSPGQSSAEVDFDVTVSDNCSVINDLEGFTALGSIDGKSYYISDSLFTPEEAYIDAFDYQGYVGTIRNEADNQYILNAVQTFVGGSNSILIGYSDVFSEGNFEWNSGDPSTYTNWNIDEPNNSGAGMVPENYTIMLSSGLWNDVAGADAFFRYLIEIDYVIEQTEGLASGSDFPLGTTTNTFVATDLAGNSVDCQFDVTVSTSSSVEDQLLSNGLTLSPNPTAINQISVSNESNIMIENLMVYDIFGKLIHVERMNLANGVQTIDIGNLSTGVYLVKLIGEKGSTTKKLIKE